MNRLSGCFAATSLAGMLGISPGSALAQGTIVEFAAFPVGLQEVPVVLTTGSGRLEVQLLDSNTLQYVLGYQGLESDITQSHIHVGQRGVNGGIAVWLCSTDAVTPPPGFDTQCVPGTSGEVTGVITADDVLPIAPQGLSDIATAEQRFQELIQAMVRGATYANIHTVISPGGEIRGQVRPSDIDFGVGGEVGDAPDAAAE